jgi:hypothetical protein
MDEGHEHGGTSATAEQPSEEEMRAAYEAELNRITSAEMIIQTAVSLLNIGGRRLGLAPPAGGPAASPAGAERDLEQVRDAIDGVSALLPVLERRMPGELGPLRDALAQLQVAYAREAQSAQGTAPAAAQATPPVQGTAPSQGTASQAPAQADQATQSSTGQAPSSEPPKPAGQSGKPGEGEPEKGPGPAQASGRLWVPGR